jgi:hypothetical protein
LFDIEIKIDKLVCHSGGAKGSDSIFESVCMQNNIEVKAYSYKTKYHISPNKIEISEEDYKEGMSEIYKANRFLNRWGINKYMNLLARNWAQVKYSDEIFAIGYIIKSGSKGQKGYYNNSKFDVVDGGTSYSIQMGINHKRPIHVFEQNKKKWYRWSYITDTFIEENDPVISKENFAGVGTREINEFGCKAIKDLIERSVSFIQ